MKLCIPTENDGGLEARLSTHFGRAPYFTVVASETAAALVLPNAGAVHGHGHCADAGATFDGHDVQAVVCRGIGGGALARLRERGIGVYLTKASTVAEALRVFLEGGLPHAGAEAVCAGGHEHGHGHSHD
jgi:predicted Fe-Mo cluster-binding NifX family protein